MISPEAVREVDALTRGYRFVFPDRSLRGRNGELLGKSVGGAIEFHDHRPYFLGDDIRHIDWMVYGRSGALVLKSYREEVTPATEIIADFSRSMAFGAGKEELVRSLVLLIVTLLRSNAVVPVLWKCAAEPERIAFEHRQAVSDHPFAGRVSIRDLMARHYIKLKANSMRIAVSDFLFPHDPAALIRQLASGGAGMLVVQVLSAEDAEPRLAGGCLMEDCETGEEWSIRVNPEILASYRARVKELTRTLEAACRRVGAGFVQATVNRGLRETLRHLVAEGYLEAI